jgi:hypothetical protein
MKIKFIKHPIAVGYANDINETIEVADNIGKEFIELGIAIESTETTAKEQSTDEVETATKKINKKK